MWALPNRTGMVAVATAASSCARRPPPNSRALSPPMITVPPAASAGHSRSPDGDRPNSSSDTRASSGARPGWVAERGAAKEVPRAQVEAVPARQGHEYGEQDGADHEHPPVEGFEPGRRALGKGVCFGLAGGHQSPLLSALPT